jgi:hypothetical protein
MSKLKTKNLLTKQLLQNTGRAMGDSGDAYGRNFERLAESGIDFNEGLRVDDCSVTIPIATYLLNNLDRNKKCEKLETLLLSQLKKLDKEATSLSYGNGDELIEIIKKMSGHYYLDSIDKFIDNDNKNISFVNTYNFDSDLSQVIQFLRFNLDGTDYIILETHNGCDVRGGYSDGRVYEVTEDYFGYSLQVNCEVQIEEDGDYDFVSLYNDCTYNVELNKWVHTESGKEIFFSANGDNYEIYV